MSAYYNDNEPYAAAWLRNLISAGLIPAGDVDERPIQEVMPDDLRRYPQCHFFAGIGGWACALRLAGVADDFPVWTGSCPCQPFSTAGKRKQFSDERHLWPIWFNLISECRPPILFGEQVANGAGVWIDLVRSDLERAGYAFGASVLPAACVGAPHIRDRYWFVADADAARWANAPRLAAAQAQPDGGQAVGVGCRAPADTNGQSKHARPFDAEVAAVSEPTPHADGEPSRWPAISRGERGFWEVEPEVGRVAPGIPRAMEQLRAYGNAIVPQVAAEFIAPFVAT